jgi:competence protein ComEA
MNTKNQIRRVTAAILVAVFCVSNCFLMGCGKKTQIYLEQEETTLVENADATDGTDPTDSTNPADSMNPADNADGTDPASDASVSSAAPTQCYVYVCGAVANPGVYALSSGARVYEAVDLAGGFLEDACEEAVNLADEVADAQMIWIPTDEEAAEGELVVPAAASNASSDVSSDSDGTINLNTATAEQLMTLPGIGQSKADSIISYRESHGSFSSVEEIMNVDGIKEGVYNRIKDNIKVK